MGLPQTTSAEEPANDTHSMTSPKWFQLIEITYLIDFQRLSIEIIIKETHI